MTKLRRSVDKLWVIHVDKRAIIVLFATPIAAFPFAMKLSNLISKIPLYQSNALSDLSACCITQYVWGQYPSLTCFHHLTPQTLYSRASRNVLRYGLLIKSIRKSRSSLFFPSIQQNCFFVINFCSAISRISPSTWSNRALISWNFVAAQFGQQGRPS